MSPLREPTTTADPISIIRLPPLAILLYPSKSNCRKSICASRRKLTTCPVDHVRGSLWTGHPKYLCLSSARAGHSAKMWKEDSSSSSKHKRQPESSSGLTIDSCLFIKLCPVIICTKRLRFGLFSLRSCLECCLLSAGNHCLVCLQSVLLCHLAFHRESNESLMVRRSALAEGDGRSGTGVPYWAPCLAKASAFSFPSKPTWALIHFK